MINGKEWIHECFKQIPKFKKMEQSSPWLKEEIDGLRIAYQG
jgi:hypothetical protein